VNTDPDGLKVRICGTDGACTDVDTDLSDADFNKYFRDAKDITLKNGNIFQNGELIGSFQRLSFDDLSAQANAFIFGRGGMVDQSQRAKPIVEAAGILAVGLVAAPVIGPGTAALTAGGLAQDRINGEDPSLGGVILAVTPIKSPLKLAKKADDLISGSLKRSKSYHSELGQKTYQEIIELSKQGGLIGKAAQQMKKLIENSERLRDKIKGK
jgi:hypothetical protein